MRYSCLDPLVPDADVDHDMDGLTTAEELFTTFQTDPCDPDFDDDGVLDGSDNCPFSPNTDQADLDQDGRGDPCDNDRDGDGIHDLAIAAPNANNGAGEVLFLSTMSGEVLGRLEGVQPGSRFGAAMTLWNLEAFAVGAPGNDEVPGSVHLVSLATLDTSTPIENGQPGDGFGASLLAVDWDGIDSLLIGAPGDAERGALFGWKGTDEPDRIAQGAAIGDQFGAALARAGDLTHDGLAEVLVGAPSASRPLEPGDSQLARHDARPMDSHLAQTGEVILLSLNGQRIWARTGSEPNERFGAALAALSLNEGPVYQFLVGAPGWRTNIGRAYMITADNEVSLILQGERENAELGRWVAAGPDYDGDGFPSLLVGEPGIGGSEPIPGRTTAFEAFSRPALGSPRLRDDGRIEFSVRGRPGVYYQLEASGDLITWMMVESILANNTVVRFTEAQAADRSARFYRLSPAPPP